MAKKDESLDQYGVWVKPEEPEEIETIDFSLSDETTAIPPQEKIDDEISKETEETNSSITSDFSDDIFSDIDNSDEETNNELLSNIDSFEESDEDMSKQSEILENILAEIQSIKTDINNIKTDVTNLKAKVGLDSETPKSDNSAFFEDDEDETIALSENELNDFVNDDETDITADETVSNESISLDDVSLDEFETKETTEISENDAFLAQTKAELNEKSIDELNSELPIQNSEDLDLEAMLDEASNDNDDISDEEFFNAFEAEDNESSTTTNTEEIGEKITPTDENFDFADDLDFTIMDKDEVEATDKEEGDVPFGEDIEDESISLTDDELLDVFNNNDIDIVDEGDAELATSDSMEAALSEEDAPCASEIDDDFTSIDLLDDDDTSPFDDEDIQVEDQTDEGIVKDSNNSENETQSETEDFNLDDNFVVDDNSNMEEDELNLDDDLLFGTNPNQPDSADSISLDDFNLPEDNDAISNSEETTETKAEDTLEEIDENEEPISFDISPNPDADIPLKDETTHLVEDTEEDLDLASLDFDNLDTNDNDELVLDEETLPNDADEAPIETEPTTPTTEETIYNLFTKEELVDLLGYLDKLLDSLPEDKIREFANSSYFDIYKKVFKALGIR